MDVQKTELSSEQKFIIHKLILEVLYMVKLLFTNFF